MKKSINIGIILLFLLQACSDQENTKNQTDLDKIPEDTPINLPQVSENSVENEIIENEVQVEEQSKPEANTEIADIKEVLKEFPQGALSFLGDNEKQCISQISTTESLKSMEKSLMEEGAILQEHMDYFTSCNLPGPPGIGIKEATSSNDNEIVQETYYATSFASVENIRSLDEDGVSPHLEKVDDKTLRLFYSSIEVKGCLLYTSPSPRDA